MAHEVKFSVPERPLGYKDVEFTVYKRGKRFGKLRVSKGNVVWTPSGKVKGYWLRWSQIDEYARAVGRLRKTAF